MWVTKAIIQGLLCLAGEAVEMTRVDTPTDGTGSAGSLALPPPCASSSSAPITHTPGKKDPRSWSGCFHGHNLHSDNEGGGGRERG